MPNSTTAVVCRNLAVWLTMEILKSGEKSNKISEERETNT